MWATVADIGGFGMRWFFWVHLFLSACSSGPETKKDMGVAPKDSGPDYGCDSIGDECIEMACSACVESCGVECETMDSYPMQYACESEGWTVYDFCPDWTPEDSGE
jgi:hypothetical protein